MPRDAWRRRRLRTRVRMATVRRRARHCDAGRRRTRTRAPFAREPIHLAHAADRMYGLRVATRPGTCARSRLRRALRETAHATTPARTAEARYLRRRLMRV